MCFLGDLIHLAVERKGKRGGQRRQGVWNTSIDENVQDLHLILHEHGDDISLGRVLRLPPPKP